MKILVAPGFFKGSLPALDAANIIREAVLAVDNTIEIETVPIADGGDGTIDSIKTFTDCIEMVSPVSGPLGEVINARWLVLSDKRTAVIEAAQANGLSLLTPERYNPLIATTYGVGELIKHALDTNCNKIYITLGGSSTNDGGKGLLEALGAVFLEEDIDLSGLDKRLKTAHITAACDVDNPLCGPGGASAVYAPQKGASPEDVRLLDERLSRFADIAAQKLGHDYRNIPGAGAAGGLGFGLRAFLDAGMIPGFQFIAQLSGLEEKIKTANMVITTEGKLDSQTLQGKAPFRIAKLAQKYNIPVIVLAGTVEQGVNCQDAGITGAFSIVNGPMSTDCAMKSAASLLSNTVKQLISVIIKMK